MPHTCRSRYPPRSSQLGGFPTFAARLSDEEVAPIPVIRLEAPCGGYRRAEPAGDFVIGSGRPQFSLGVVQFLIL